MARSAPSRRGPADDDGQPRTRFGYIGSYSTVDNARLEALAAIPAKEGGLTDRQFRVFQWFVGATQEFDEPVMMSTERIAARLHTTADALNKIERVLAKRRLLFVAEEFGRQRFYRVSPYFASQGTSAQQREAIRHVNPPDIPGLQGYINKVRGVA